MALFPRAFTQEFSPLIRLMDDYANISRDLQGTPGAVLKSLRSFQPKFDVSETKEGYQLHGELPGIDQKDINIEWTDGNTLEISGRTETRHESGSPEQGKVTGEATESHQPTVEDETGPSSTEAQPTSTEVAKASSQEVSKEPQRKYWVTERSVGEFHRSFSFPARVDHDAVKASMKNGVLEITVPKAAKPAARKINIE
jgi:HSP20 family molecular chaperone IbpA